MKNEELLREEELEPACSMGLVSTALATHRDAPGRFAWSARAPAREVTALLGGTDPLPPLCAEDFVFPV
ncbi:hypothetical protein [Anaeromyxobacter oryzae]|uniref:Uncharacterized protein n=1 Tax=Anaeromyxobacter oryzae TaxID=2918170 RepID=A0ABM7X1U0_9BACT|nr:hypothetical protein [Anaeromyxobacter oryzae]BDG05755.1 hypothetical protein AMOR_47510 [Anaeromyxobacter oryzae]